MATAPSKSKRARGLDDDEWAPLIGVPASQLDDDKQRLRTLYNDPKFSDRVIELRAPPPEPSSASTAAPGNSATATIAEARNTRQSNKRVRAAEEAASGTLLRSIHVSTAIVAAKSTFLYSAISETR